MSPMHVLTEMFTPSARSGVAFSAMPDAPVLPFTASRRPLRRLGSALRRAGVRMHSSLPLATSAPAPVRAECSPS
jgi:hypothetical protein